jgi:hypothetical protein
MSEKSESDEFEDDEPVIQDGDSDDDLERVDRVFKDLDLAKRRGQKVGDPAWRKLERLLEDKRTAELTSDIEDYPIGLEDEDRDDGEERDGPADEDGPDEPLRKPEP